MNPLRFVVTLLFALILPAAAAEVAATFTSATTVPVTAASYTATGITVNLALAFAPPTGTNLTVVNHTGAAFIQGAFDNLAQGQVVNLAYNGITYPFAANYFGGTGNDLVLQWVNTRLLAWGDNYYGQLGDGGTVLRKAPVEVDTAGVLSGKTVLQLASGDRYSVALCADGTLAAWGENAYGQLGDNSTTDRWTPGLLNQAGVLSGKEMVAVACGTSHNLALCSDGTLAAWGLNTGGQLGNASYSNSMVPVAVDRTGVLAGKVVIAVAAGNSHSLVLCADGTLAAWGSGALGTSSVSGSYRPVAVDQAGVLAGKTVVGIAAGGYHNVVRCSDGSMATWGYNSSGQLGTNTKPDSLVPVPVDQTGVLAGKTVVAVSAGTYHTFALCSDGTVNAWGNNSNGQLGNGNRIDQAAPVIVDRTGVLAGKSVVSISGGQSHSLACCADGTMAAWGLNTYGQLGLAGGGGLWDSVVPVLVSNGSMRAGERVVGLATGGRHCLATVAAAPPPLVTTLPTSGIVDTGATLNGVVNPNSSSATVSFEYGPTTAYGSAVSANPSFITGAADTPTSATVGSLLSGTTYHYRIVATGLNGTVKGQDLTFTTSRFASLTKLALHAGTLSPVFSETRTNYVATVPFSLVSVRLTPTIAFASSTVRVNGIDVASGSASDPIALVVGANPIEIMVSATGGGNSKTYTVTLTRLPDTLVFNSEADVPITTADLAASGNSVRFALNFAPLPGSRLTVVNNTGAAPIRGYFTGLAQGQRVELTHEGVVYSFVANYFGATGNDLVLQWENIRLLWWGGGNITVPQALDMTGVLAGKSVSAVAAGDWHGLALCVDGTVAAWGDNIAGQLGNNSRTSGSVPVSVVTSGVLAGKKVLRVAAGYRHSLVLCTDGTLAAWGANSVGELGNGTTTDSLVPVPVSRWGVLASKTVVAIAVGGRHNLVLCSDGTLAAWGENANGQVGNISTPKSLVPVLVEQTGVLAGKTVVALAAGYAHNLVLCSDGTLAAWGSNSLGKLGNNSMTDSKVPVLVDRAGVLADKAVVAIAAGRSHSLGLCADGTMASWGDDFHGQLGNDSSSFSFSKVPLLVNQTGLLSGKTVIGLSAHSGDHSLAWCADGTVAAWGDNYYGQLGDGSKTNRTLPIWVNRDGLQAGERVAAAVAGGYNSISLVATPPPPAVITLAASRISATAATLNGSVNAAGGNLAVVFEYGPTDRYGTTVVATPSTVAGSSLVAVACPVTGLVAGVHYHYRVVATESKATTSGDDMTFTTGNPPEFAGYTVATPWQTAATIPLRKILAKASDPDGDLFAVTAAGPASAQGGTAVLQGSSILYTPATGFSGTDSFSVTLADARGASVIGTVTVTVGPGPNGGGAGANPPVLTVLPGGEMGLAFQGIPGRSYIVQRSVSGLDNWVTLATIPADASGKVSYTDESPPAGSAFYRLGIP